MGRQIIKQPDGKFSVWSTIVDDFVYTDCTKEELEKELLEEEIEKAKEKFEEWFPKEFEKADLKTKGQFRMTYEECLETIEERHGEDEDV